MRTGEKIGARLHQPLERLSADETEPEFGTRVRERAEWKGRPRENFVTAMHMASGGVRPPLVRCLGEA